MSRRARLACAALMMAGLLGGCLSTKEPVFDASNSRPVGEIPEFLAFVEAWEAFSGKDSSPRELINDGARGIVVDGILVVQEHTDYYALSVMGHRPISCLVYADSGIEDVAKAHGVTVTVDKPEDRSLDDAPVPVLADGPPSALMAFIRDQFANRRLACIATARAGE